MTYDFTTIMERRGKDAMAVDALGLQGFPGAPKEGFDAIPMWVADMNFPTVPTITEAIARRIAHPAFGYFLPSDAYYDAIIRWQQTRNGVEDLTPEAIGYENGVLGGVTSALAVLCSRGDKVLVHSPTYIGFTGTLTNNGYEIVHSPLVLDEAGIWRMDFADMEEKLSSQHIHAAILCSPHNPSGRVWERWELARAMALFEKYLHEAIDEMEQDHIRLKILGEPGPISPKLRALISRTDEISTHYQGFQANICINYGGRDEIVHAARRFAADCVQGLKQPEELTECDFAHYLYTDGIPDPELIIRPSGEIRTSNFLLWQSAYAEYYFTDVLWPDFDEQELDKAIASYRMRERRFGGRK